MVYAPKKTAGFTSAELIIAVGCVSFLIIVVASLSTLALSSELQTRGVQEAIAQRGEIRDLLLKIPATTGTTSSSCTSRLGLTGSEAFNPNQEFELVNFQLPDEFSAVKLDKIALTEGKNVGTRGTSTVYSVQVVVNQSVNAAITSHSLQPSILGLMTVVVDNSGRISGCNWDPETSNALQFCDETTGTNILTSPNGVRCVPEIQAPQLGSCPGGTAMDLIANHCVPADVSCYSKALAQNFDGSSLGCSFIPSTYAIEYPQGYQPPDAPIDPDRSPASSNTAGGQTESQPVAQPTPQPCTCGPTQIAAGGNQLCVTKTSFSDGILGAHDDRYAVKVCNSVGVLEPGDPAGYFDEEGSGGSWGPRVATCSRYGGTTYSQGVVYAIGRCY